MPAKKQTKQETTQKQSKDKTMEIVGLIVNLFIPGLGTIIAATKRKEYMNTGIIQLVIWVVGMILTLILIGPLIILGDWIWALVVSIKMLTKE